GPRGTESAEFDRNAESQQTAGSDAVALATRRAGREVSFGGVAAKLVGKCPGFCKGVDQRAGHQSRASLSKARSDGARMLRADSCPALGLCRQLVERGFGRQARGDQRLAWGSKGGA